jgi:hypothetical protein
VLAPAGADACYPANADRAPSPAKKTPYFSALPLLANLLEEAGCPEQSVLDHCRVPGEHARGCWVVDLVLGKG